MGISSSKTRDTISGSKRSDKLSSFADRVKANVEEEFFKRTMMQREIEMALNVAKARDNIQIFGSGWLALVTGVGAAKAAGRHVPGILGVPIVVGAFVLGNLADLAYGNKLQRVCREAEYILDNEKERFVPFPQAPFARFYTAEQKAAMYDKATPVGELWPSSMVARPKSL
jgi:Uncharacterised conserved protein (DUF2368)